MEQRWAHLRAASPQTAPVLTAWGLDGLPEEHGPPVLFFRQKGTFLLSYPTVKDLNPSKIFPDNVLYEVGTP